MRHNAAWLRVFFAVVGLFANVSSLQFLGIICKHMRTSHVSMHTFEVHTLRGWCFRTSMNFNEGTIYSLALFTRPCIMVIGGIWHCGGVAVTFSLFCLPNAVTRLPLLLASFSSMTHLSEHLETLG